ncbi:hypothetical protein VUR80DRAFT_5779 [Thermomyces stellatus]
MSGRDTTTMPPRGTDPDAPTPAATSDNGPDALASSVRSLDIRASDASNPKQHGNDVRTTSSGAHDEPDPSRASLPNPLAAAAGPGGGARRQSNSATTPPARGDGHGLPFVKPSSYLRRKPTTSGRRTMAEKPAPSPLDREQMQGLVSSSLSYCLLPFLVGQGEII